jgi:uncharacterized protein (TIGR00255 family)
MKSMTGFGRGEVSTPEFRLSVEITSVNRKQADIVINLPRDWHALELEARKLVAGQVSRGRVHLQVHLEWTRGTTTQLQYDEVLAAQYIQAIKSLAEANGLIGDLSPRDLLRAPGVFSTGETKNSPEEIWPHLEQAIRVGMETFQQSREREGAHLLADLQQRLQTIRQLSDQIASLSPDVVRLHRDLLRKRLEEAGLNVALEDERLLKEIAIYADKCDITEEVTRLQGHLDEFHRLLQSSEPQGRAMDFLTQELNRELNTMGSKGNSTAIAHLVVAGKTEVERIREQVQNVE